jgi:hypothetical protein
MNETADPQTKPLTQGLARPISVRNEFIILILLIFFAFLIRIVRLGSFPDTVLADEADNATTSAQILYGHPPDNGFFGLDWTDQPAISAYKEAGFIEFFGFSILAIRFSSALISTLAIIPFYLLLRLQFTILSSSLASILLATDVWFLNFSRSGWNCIDIAFYMLMAMLLLMLAVNAMAASNKKSWQTWGYFAAAGSFCALGLYGYPAGRAITLAVAAFFPVLLIFYRKHLKSIIFGYLILFAVEAALFAPQAIYIVNHWQLFNGRASVVFILNDPQYKADPVGFMSLQLSNNLQGPWSGLVNNTPQYSPGGEPQLDGFTGFLVLIGMILTFVDYRIRKRPETWLWWLMLLTGWAATQLTTAGTPNGARGIGYMPTLIYFAGVSLDIMVMDLDHLTAGSKWPLLSSRSAGAILVGVVLVAGCINVKHYVDWQNNPQTRTGRYLYVTAREFPEWTADLVNRLKTDRGTLNVGQWRELFPVADISNPYGDTP